MSISCDPQDLVRAAACFDSCIPKGMHKAIQTYLLCQLVNGGSAPATCSFQQGAGSPVGSVTPEFIGQLYHDLTGDTYYRSTGLTNADWTLIGSAPVICEALSGAGSPVGSVAPEFIGQLYHDTVADTYYRSTGLTNADWTLISGTVPGVMTFISTTYDTFAASVSDADTAYYFPNLVSISDFNVAGAASLTTVDLSALTSASNNIDATDCTALTTFDVTALTTVGGLFITGCTSLASLDISALVNLGNTLDASGCTALTSVLCAAMVPAEGCNITFNGDALTATSVELILRRCVLAGLTTATIDLSGGTNAGTSSLSAQGQADVATLGAQLTMNP